MRLLGQLGVEEGEFLREGGREGGRICERREGKENERREKIRTSLIERQGGREGGRKGGKETHLVDGHEVTHGVGAVAIDDVHQHAASLHMPAEGEEEIGKGKREGRERGE